MLSIIIPTLNEEKYLSCLLDSIAKQNFSDYELIVADFNSFDRTREIAKEYGAKVVAGGLPARAKNNGADIAKGELLFFLDADALLPPDFFTKTIKEIKKRNLKIISFRLVPSDKKFIQFLFDIFYNFPIFLLGRLLPHGAMGIIIEREIFKKTSGFDEDIKLAEDHEFVRRAAKTAKFGIIRTTNIFVSDRRFKKDGWLRTYLKYIICELHMIFLGPVRSDIFKYRFNHYSKKNKNRV